MINQQYRPILPNLPANADSYTRQLHDTINQAFRQAFDNINNQANSNSPTSLFAKGSGKTVPVPVSTTKAGSGFGLAVTLNRPGTWVVTASVVVNIKSDPSSNFKLSLNVGNVLQPNTGKLSSATDGTYTMHQSWSITSSNGKELCSLLIVKDAGGGTSNVDVQNSTLTATWQGS